MIKERIQALAKKEHLSLTKLEEILGFGNGTITKWNHSTPKVDKLYEVAKYFHVTLDYLYNGNSYATTPNQNVQPFMVSDKMDTTYNTQSPINRSIKIPILNVTTSATSNVTNTNLPYEEISSTLVSQGVSYAFQMLDDTMSPTLYSGDIAILKKQSNVEDGELAGLFIDGELPTIREVRVIPEGILLVSHNVNQHTPQFYSHQELAEQPFTIIGKVIEIRRKLYS